ncbi:hypothetical protein A3D11_03965 [Candidatus Peribacteria bacterium RIFCSPHIGHO2_02_FULL_49_16]|nr:MAG: hypothetical protein A2880_03200 [Candidatus Peribacteria bacterium RIFCSPHIGHO2_01_FULL_49_38]OGJ59157.1 MAG: hypothetical protein A3D11_03965 [Candidatus Peribacteria bacterium RIFCSPHIGHO2_02_FULL_49_16]
MGRYLPLLLLACAFGYTVGRIVSLYEERYGTTMTLQPDTRESIPVVEIRGVEEGKLVGEIKGNVRVFLGSKQIFTDADGSFAVPAETLLINDIWVSIPDGAKFVASKRGTKYYSIDSSGGQRIVPENRVYFGSKEEAEKQGYVR